MQFEEIDDWSGRARCKDMEVAFFYPGRGESVYPMKEVCRLCPVVKPCLEYAMRNSEKFGIWGSTSERERRKMRGARRRYRQQDVSVTISHLLHQFGFNISNLVESELDSFSGEDGYE
jgi:WhiB family redox-sensing transcriptional regulator